MWNLLASQTCCCQPGFPHVWDLNHCVHEWWAMWSTYSLLSKWPTVKALSSVSDLLLPGLLMNGRYSRNRLFGNTHIYAENP